MSKYGGQTRATLKSNKLAPKKKFGQNFLVNKHTAEAIVHAGNVKNDQTIIEVGVGLGALTIPLAKQAKKVIGFEIDRGIIRFHEEELDLPANVTLVHQDILKADFNEISQQVGGPLKILANLPYSISNPFIFKLIESFSVIDSATIMLQKEVGDRLMAEPNCKDYGIPTVMLGCCATVTKLMTLKPGEFHPRPKIDSVVLNIKFSDTLLNPENQEQPYNFKLVNTLVRTSFNQRRKTIQNTLSSAELFSSGTGIDKVRNKELTTEGILAAQLKTQARPENLSIADFIRLSGEIERLLSTLNKVD